MMNTLSYSDSSHTSPVMPHAPNSDLDVLAFEAVAPDEQSSDLDVFVFDTVTPSEHTSGLDVFAFDTVTSCEQNSDFAIDIPEYDSVQGPPAENSSQTQNDQDDWRWMFYPSIEPDFSYDATSPMNEQSLSISAIASSLNPTRRSISGSFYAADNHLLGTRDAGMARIDDYALDNFMDVNSFDPESEYFSRQTSSSSEFHQSFTQEDADFYSANEAYSGNNTFVLQDLAAFSDYSSQNFVLEASIDQTAELIQPPAVQNGNGRVQCLYPGCTRTFRRDYERTRHYSSRHMDSTDSRLIPFFYSPSPHVSSTYAQSACRLSCSF